MWLHVVPFGDGRGHAAAGVSGRKLGVDSCCVFDLGLLPEHTSRATRRSGESGHRVARAGCCANTAERTSDGQSRRAGLSGVFCKRDRVLVSRGTKGTLD
jgi:hypothetical protein